MKGKEKLPTETKRQPRPQNHPPVQTPRCERAQRRNRIPERALAIAKLNEASHRQEKSLKH